MQNIYNIKNKANSGDPSAQLDLGEMYYLGTNKILKDYQQAFFGYQKAASQGCSEAQERVGWAYDSGEGIKKSYKKAVFWYRKAAKQGRPVAQYNLGLNYLTGIGVTKSHEDAFLWTKKAALQGYSSAILALGWHYHGGIGVREDIEKAKKWYNKCLETDCKKTAYFNLGQIAYEVEGNYQEAFEYFNQAIQYNHSKSYYYLGRMYFEGKGIFLNIIKAKEYLSKAHKAGIYNATRLLKSKKFRDLSRK